MKRYRVTRRFAISVMNLELMIIGGKEIMRLPNNVVGDTHDILLIGPQVPTSLA